MLLVQRPEVHTSHAALFLTPGSYWHSLCKQLSFSLNFSNSLTDLLQGTTSYLSFYSSAQIYLIYSLFSFLCAHVCVCVCVYVYRCVCVYGVVCVSQAFILHSPPGLSSDFPVLE